MARGPGKGFQVRPLSVVQNTPARAQIAEVTGLDHLQELAAVDDLPTLERLAVGPLRRRGHAHREGGILFADAQVRQNPLVALRREVMGLVDDDRMKVRGDALESALPRERLHARDDDCRLRFVGLGLDDADVRGRSDELQLLDRLADQLIAMNEHERATRALANLFGKDHSLAGPRRQRDDLATDAALLGVSARGQRLELVVAELDHGTGSRHSRSAPLTASRVLASKRRATLGAHACAFHRSAARPRFPSWRAGAIWLAFLRRSSVFGLTLRRAASSFVVSSSPTRSPRAGSVASAVIVARYSVQTFSPASS